MRSVEALDTRDLAGCEMFSKCPTYGLFFLFSRRQQFVRWRRSLVKKRLWAQIDRGVAGHGTATMGTGRGGRLRRPAWSIDSIGLDPGRPTTGLANLTFLVILTPMNSITRLGVLTGSAASQALEKSREQNWLRPTRSPYINSSHCPERV